MRPTLRKFDVWVFGAILLCMLFGLSAQQPTTGQYFYDDLGQLVKVVYPTGDVVTYTYDSVGNILSITKTTLPSPNSLAIFSVNPQRGDVGQTVLIQGQGFSATPASDSVQFNGTAATVTAASATQLNVTVPFGATTGPLTVTVGGVTAQAATFAVNPYVLSLEVTPINPSIALGQTQRFSVTGNLSDNTTKDVTASVTWSSANAAVATIGSNGVAISVATGTTNITAGLSVPLAPGGQLTNSTTLTVATTAVVSLAVTPSNFTAPTGQNVQFTATGTFSNGTSQNLTTSATWSSSNTAVATISNAAGSQGLASTLVAGTATIQATVGTVTGSTTLTVSAAGSGTIPRFAYVPNSDGTISIFSINPTTGDLRPNGYVTYGPVAALSSLTLNDAVIDPFNRFLYSATFHNGTVFPNPNEIWGYSVNAVNGGLTPISGSPFILPTGVGITPNAGLSIDPLSKFLYFAGGLASISPSNGALGSFTPLSFFNNCVVNVTTIHPSGKFLYSPTGVGNPGGICAFSIDATTGLLTTISGSPFPAGAGPLVLALDPAGKFAYATNSNGDNISAYTVDPASGVLTQIAGSPFAAGTVPEEVTVDPLSRFVYVGNQASNNISAYTINATTGALTPVPGSPFSTCTSFGCEGANALVEDPAGNFLYTTASPTDNILIFSIDPSTGALTFLKSVKARGTPAYSIAIAKGTAAVTYTPKFAYAGNSGSNNLSAYTIEPTSGALTAISGSPFPAGTQPSFIAVHPTGKFAYAVNTSDQTISAFTVDPSTGTLTQIGSPIPEGQVGPVAVTVEPSGRFLYVVNTNVTGMQGSVSAYQIDSTSGALTPITGSPFAAGTNPVSITIDLEGEFMFVPNSGSNNVSLYQIPPLQQSPQTPAGALISSAGTLNAGTNPSSVALHPSGGFLYIANSGSGDIWMYCPNAAYDSFKLSNCSTGFQSVITTVGPNLQSVVIDTSGKYLYVAGGTSGSGSLWAYSINQTTGALTAVTGSPFVVGVNPTSITIDNSGQFVYVTNSGSNSISVFKIDPNTGALTAVAGSPFPAGTTPKFITTFGTVQ